MKSISIKIKLTTALVASVMVGIVLYAKADMNSVDENENNSYTIVSSATTNLNASMKAYPRASEYTSSEYTAKMAPATTGAAEYLAVHQDRRGDTYQRKVAPATHAKPVPVNTPVEGEQGQRPAQSASTTYKSYGVRAASTKKNNEKDTSTEIAESKTAFISSDEYSRKRVTGTSDYANSIENAAKNDDAYQVRSSPQDTGVAPQKKQGTEESYGGYNVRSIKTPSTVAPRNVANTPTPQSSTGSYGGYAIRSAAGKDVSSAQGQPATTGGEAYKGYARKSVNSTDGTTSAAQYDNAKNSDEVYQVKKAPTSSSASGESYGGYAVRSPRTVKTAAEQKSTPTTVSTSSQNVAASEGTYARKSVPAGSSSTAQQRTTPQTTGSSYGGYAVKSAGGKDVSTAQAPASSGESYGGYAVKKSGQKRQATSVAQHDNANKSDNAYNTKTKASGETYGGYAVRSAGGRDVASSRATAASGETYSGYAVRSAGQKRQTASLTQATSTPSTVKRGIGTPASTGIKIYNNRGQQVNLNTPQKNRSVLVMPKRGRSTAGLVVQDDPGRSIIVQSTTGTQSTYRYGEIDALVNL